MSMRSRLCNLVLLIGLAPAAALAMDIETATGLVTIAETPETIAVFDIAAVDTLANLGVPIDGLPAKLYLPELAPLQQDATTVGDIFEPDLEALSALGPDLIILGGRSSPKVASTSAVAQTIDMTIDGEDLVGLAKNRLATYGALFGKKAEAMAIAERLDAVVSKARSAVAGKGRGLIVMTNGPKVSAYGAGSRFGWIHAALGLPPATDDVDAAIHGEAVSFEFIAQADPDWLLVLDRAAAIGSNDQAARATLDNELVAGTTAWKKGQVIYLPSADFYIAAGGTQALERVLDTIAEAFSRRAK